MEKELWKSKIRIINDFPQKGIKFYDLLPVFEDYLTFKNLIDELLKMIPKNIDFIAGPDARGFLIGPPLALAKNIGFVAIRKKNKIPGAVFFEKYSLEYGEDILEISQNNFKNISKPVNVLIVDDLVATGNTLLAAAKLLEKFKNVHVKGILTIMQLKELNSKKYLNKYGYKLDSLLII